MPLTSARAEGRISPLTGSTDTNPRGGSAMNYLVSKTRNILNTFVICNRGKVLTWH